MRELPRTFDRSSPEHFAHLLLVKAKMRRVDAPDMLLVAAAWSFDIIPYSPDELHGTYSLVRMKIGTQARREAERRRQVGHEMGHVVQSIVGVPEPHDEDFTERIRLAASMPPRVIRPLVEAGATIDELAAVFPLVSTQEIVRRVLALPINRRFPQKTKAAQARLVLASGWRSGRPWHAC